MVYVTIVIINASVCSLCFTVVVF